MKIFRAALFAALIVFALLQAGCRSTWTVDFTDLEEANQEMPDWGGYTSWNLYEEPISGMDVYQDHVTSPIGFIGDFTLTLDMYLDVSPSNTATFRIWIGEDDGISPANSVLCEFKETGDSLNENEELYIYVEDQGTEDPEFGPIKPIPGLKQGLNRFKLDKNGNDIEIRLNGALLKELTVDFSDNSASFVSFVTDEYSNVRVIFKKISVSYEGDPVWLFV